MAQKKKCAASHGHGNLANRKAKKSILKPNIIITNTEKFDQISNGEEESTRKFNLSRCQHKKKKNQICKGKSISNDNTHQMEIHQVTRIHFQEEIMMDILRTLPVRSLLRFKCVSKFWKSLINDPYFRRTHYIHNRDDQNSQKLLTIERLFMKDFDFYTCSLSMREDKQKLDWPSSCKPKIALIFCSCDGLVLTLVSSGGYYEELVLWNPSTRESRLLPHPEFPVRTCVCGLKYDATSEDYKILAISLNAIDSSYTSIQLFSLKSGSWRRIGYPTGIKPKPVRGFMDSGMDYLAFLHGAFHWLAMSCSGYYTTVSFNISNEVYGEVPLLEQMFGVSPRYYIIDHGVSVLRGMLCFYSTHNHWTEGRIGTFKLWIMKDYGVRESWIKLIEIRDTNLFHSARPKYMFADCEVLLQCKGNRCCNSIFTTSRGPFKSCPKCNITKRGIVYAESFISPNSLT
ncbi:F-box/kelch-repeat protein At3g23880-like [Solanum tuberosum]|nr:PREDICTED: F-box/kelch-repeat protein At3g23880-like [Solanum tuberosum]